MKFTRLTDELTGRHFAHG